MIRAGRGFQGRFRIRIRGRGLGDIFAFFSSYIHIFNLYIYIYIHICILSVERFEHEPLGSGDWVTTPYVTDVK